MYLNRKELLLDTQQCTQQKAVVTRTLSVVSSIYRRLCTYVENDFLSNETLASQMPPTYYCIKVTGMKLYLQSKEVICLSHIHLFNWRFPVALNCPQGCSCHQEF